MHYGDNNINAGPLKEFKEICIDRFSGNDLKCTTFFLSHAHTDHMVGLDTAAFARRLQDTEVKLYCQTLTPMFVAHFERYLGGQSGIADLIRAHKLVSLDADKPLTLEIPARPSSYAVKVTLIRAGHCPGSVMFLFETESKRILHTGDFRLSISDLKGIDHLHVGRNDKKKPKSFDHLYVDTTFCSLGAPHFPCRQQATKEAIEHIREWITTGENHYVNISFPARFAHEYTLMALYKAFGIKIHVDQERFDIYDMIPGLQDCVTLDPQTKFHLKCNSEDCRKEKEYMTVRLSSLWYTQIPDNLVERPSILKTGRNIIVCYAMHSSLNEIAEMIDYLKPTIVTPLVNPAGADIDEVNACLRSICKWDFEFENYHQPRVPPTPKQSKRGNRFNCFNRKNNNNSNNNTSSASVQIEANKNGQCDTVKKDEIEIQKSFEELLAEEEEDQESDDDWTTKRFKRDDGDSSKWDFPFTPSPRKRGSSDGGGSSANSSRNNSQELVPKICISEKIVCNETKVIQKDVLVENQKVVVQIELDSKDKEEEEEEEKENGENENKERTLVIGEEIKVVRNLDSQLDKVVTVELEDSDSETASFPSQSMLQFLEECDNPEEKEDDYHSVIDLTFDSQ